ncbi:hypothetical protein L3Q82_016225 [Scortum barcoo]|uniref:Uncharacterized protein n=1 Tax=Scortum barcoo TaxID=214431 RepID=A0ACB8VQE2_9TELE|nr:hypothetical protein L3Q82_016225 [Scortum barcoo]
MNAAHLVKKAQQRRAGLSPQLLTNFYRATIESILCLSAAVWYGSCTAQDQKDLAWVVKTAQGIVGSPLPDLDSIYAGRIQKKAQHIAADPTHLGNGLFGQTKSGSQEAHHEKKNIKDRYVARIGVTGAPPWSQAWGWGSQASAWWPGSLPTGPGRAQPRNGDVGPRLPVGSPPAGRSMRGWCNVVWVAVVAGGLDDPIPGPKLWQ